MINDVLLEVEASVGAFRRMNKRQALFQLLNLGLVIFSAYMSWKASAVFFNTESPLVVVLSESMSPGFERGDILFLTLDDKRPFQKGDICVFKLKGRDIPIVHRILKIHEYPDGKVKFLTKGDHNEVHDRGLYNRGQKWLEREDVMGVVRGYIPYLGRITIIMNDYPKLKYLLIASVSYFVLSVRE